MDHPGKEMRPCIDPFIVEVKQRKSTAMDTAERQTIASFDVSILLHPWRSVFALRRNRHRLAHRLGHLEGIDPGGRICCTSIV